MVFIVDTHAWIEYFSGSRWGKGIKDTVESGGNITPTIVLAEMKRKYTEWGRTDFDERLQFIEARSQVMPLDKETAVLAGEIRSKQPVRGMGLVDCILLAHAGILGAKVLTGDQHFKGLPEAEFIDENSDD